MLKAIFLIGLGGGIGSILRFLVSVFINRYFQSAFPWATFVVNILGCLIIGILLGVFTRQQPVDSNIQLLFVTGFCGGFTTFSTFSSENFSLIQAGNSSFAFLYIIASVLIGLLAVWLGLFLSKI